MRLNKFMLVAWIIQKFDYGYDLKVCFCYQTVNVDFCLQKTFLFSQVDCMVVCMFCLPKVFLIFPYGSYGVHIWTHSQDDSEEIIITSLGMMLNS